jgi:pimeloyl-ACP methyl ester carboxylesterase
MESGSTHFSIREVEFDDLLRRPGVIRRKHIADVRQPIVTAADAAASRRTYRQRQNQLRRTVWDVPERVGSPEAIPVVIPGEIMVRLPVLGMREAGHYRHNDDVKAEILDRVSHTIASLEPPVVMIAHSLGSVVALDALHTRDIRVELLVSVGSPLGVPHFWAKPWQAEQTFPFDRLGGWLNVVNVRDPVVWGRGAQQRFPQTMDIFIEAGSGLMGQGNFHDAATYVGSATVGRAVSLALQRR